MKTKLPIFTLLSSLLFLGCTSTKMTSNLLLEETPESINDVFYAVYATKTFEKATPSLEERSNLIYAKNAIRFEQKTYTFLENDGEFNLDNVINYAKEKDFNFALLIAEDDYDYTITQNPGYWSGGMYMGGGSTSNTTHGLKATLFSVSDTSQVWRAEIKVHSGQFGNSSQSGRSLADRIVMQFIDDGLFPKNFRLLNN